MNKILIAALLSLGLVSCAYKGTKNEVIITKTTSYEVDFDNKKLTIDDKTIGYDHAEVVIYPGEKRGIAFVLTKEEDSTEITLVCDKKFLANNE